MSSRIEGILNADLEDLREMSRRDLAKNVSILASAANKRLKRLKASGEYSPAYEYIKTHGGKFSVAGKTENQLLIEYQRVSNFLTAKTSSITGVRKWHKEIKKGLAERIGADPKKVTEIFKSDADLESNFWRAFTRIKNEYDLTVLYKEEDKGFKKFMKETRKGLQNGESIDSIKTRMEKFINQWIKENPNVSESDLML